MGSRFVCSVCVAVTEPCKARKPSLGQHLQQAVASASIAAYKDFLTLWKDADPDIPILKEAKAEYAKLQ